MMFQPGTVERSRSPAGLSVAIDLGFAKTSASSGLAWHSPERSDADTFTFAECIKKVAALLAVSPVADLIIEAPLSGFFGSNGNPVERGDFEKRNASESSKAQYRYWYLGAGAATCLAALYFLREVRQQLADINSPGPRLITLYEGVLTFKSEATKHKDDAVLLCQAFRRGGDCVQDLQPPAGVTAISVLDLLTASRNSSPPPALVVPCG